MDFPNWLNLMELGIAVILIFNIVQKFPDFLVPVLGVILLIDVLIDILTG